MFARRLQVQENLTQQIAEFLETTCWGRNDRRSAALAMNGKEVTMIFPEAGIGQRIFPADLVQFPNNFYREKGDLFGLDLTGFRNLSGLIPEKLA